MRSAANAIVVAISMAATFVAASMGQAPADTYTGIATVEKESARASADVTLQIDRYAREEERSALIDSVKTGGGAAARKLLSGRPDIGFIRVGERRTAIKYAWKQPMPAGHLVTVATADPIVFIGAGLPNAKPETGFDVAIAFIEVGANETGVGELAPAAKLGLDANGSLKVQDYGSTVVWLKNLVRTK